MSVRIKLVVCALLVGFAISALPTGDSVAAVPCAKVCRQQQAVVSSAAVTTFVPTVANVFFPLYTAGYSQSPAADTSGNAELLRALILEIRGLRQDLRGAAGPGQPVPPEAAKVDPLEQMKIAALRVANNRCAACHDANVSDKKGNGFVLLNGGSFEKLTAGKAVNEMDHLWEIEKDKVMPPTNPLLDDELADLSA